MRPSPAQVSGTSTPAAQRAKSPAGRKGDRPATPIASPKSRGWWAHPRCEAARGRGVARRASFVATQIGQFAWPTRGIRGSGNEKFASSPTRVSARLPLDGKGRHAASRDRGGGAGGTARERRAGHGREGKAGHGRRDSRRDAGDVMTSLGGFASTVGVQRAHRQGACACDECALGTSYGGERYGATGSRRDPDASCCCCRCGCFCYCFCLPEQADGSIRPPAPDRSGQNGSLPLPERGEARCGMQPAGHLGWCQRSKHERHRHRIASAPGLAWPGRYHGVGSEAHRSRCSQSRGACLDSTDDPAAVAVMANACNRNHQTPLCFVPSRRSASCCPSNAMYSVRAKSRAWPVRLSTATARPG